jgi:hypothetical protein
MTPAFNLHLIDELGDSVTGLGIRSPVVPNLGWRLGYEGKHWEVIGQPLVVFPAPGSVAARDNAPITVSVEVRPAMRTDD